MNKKRLPYVSKRISHPDYAPPVVPSTSRRPDPPFLANLRRWLAELDVIDAQGVALQTKRAEIVKAITIACTGHE